MKPEKKTRIASATDQSADVDSQKHCSDCNGHLRGHGVKCGLCGWLHVKCSGLDNADKWFDGFVCGKCSHNDQPSETVENNCGKCRETIAAGVKSITCEICSKRFHGNCQKLTDEQLDFIQTIGTLHCFCDSCETVAAKLRNQVNALKQQQVEST